MLIVNAARVLPSETPEIVLFARFAVVIPAAPDRLSFVSPLIVLVEAAIDLFVKVSVVAFPTNVSVVAGNVRVPEAVEDACRFVWPVVPLKSTPEEPTVAIPVVIWFVAVKLVIIPVVAFKVTEVVTPLT